MAKKQTSQKAQPKQPADAGEPAVAAPAVQSAAEFQDVDDVQSRFRDHGYLTDTRLATTVFVQTRLEKPVLLEGPAGVGKTQLALSLAAVTGRRLVRLQCYEGQDETKALYEWDYGKQLLYTQILREKIGSLIADTTSLNDAVDRIAAQDSVFFSDRFLAPRPLLDAITSEEPVVLLIDEVDRADEALEAVLLEVLAENQISIPEVGTVKAVQPPLVILTSNNTRDLSAALKRRCLHLFLDYPEADRELAILRSKQTGLSEALEAQLVQVVRELRELDLRKAPSIAETIDWARTLAVLGVQELSGTVLAETLSVVVKYERDLVKAGLALPRITGALGMKDPNLNVPGSVGGAGHGHGHGHGHAHGSGSSHNHGDGHSHDGDHSHDEPHTHDDESSTQAPSRSNVIDLDASADTGANLDEVDPDGVAVRKAKDQPGRHGDYFGAPGGSQPVRAVSSNQGSRSFVGNRKRKG